jgi:hypothetical protein
MLFYLRGRDAGVPFRVKLKQEAKLVQKPLPPAEKLYFIQALTLQDPAFANKQFLTATCPFNSTFYNILLGFCVKWSNFIRLVKNA